MTYFSILIKISMRLRIKSEDASTWFNIEFQYTYLSATASNLSGLNVPSVSIYKHFPSAPPKLIGNWHVTAIVWHNWDLPVRNSPNNSVIDPVSIPPFKSLSSSFDPVVICVQKNYNIMSKSILMSFYNRLMRSCTILGFSLPELYLLSLDVLR